MTLQSLIRRCFQVAFLIFLSFAVHAQDDVTYESSETDESVDPYPSVEVGFNATGLIRNTLSDGTIGSDYPYDLMVNFRVSEQMYLRTGLRFRLANSNEGDDFSQSERRINFRIGLASGFDVTDRFNFSIGGDFIVGNNQFSTESSFNSDTNLSLTTFGLGPVLGIGYQLTPRFSLRAESSFYFTNTSTTNEFVRFTGSGTSTETQTSSSNRTQFLAPTNILVFVNF